MNPSQDKFNIRLWHVTDSLHKVRHINVVYMYDLVCFCAGKSEPLVKACVGYYGSHLAHAPREPTAGRLLPSCSWTSSAWAPCASRNKPFDFMKILDIGDVMNKFEVLGIVGEGERCRFIPLHNGMVWNIKVKSVHFVATVTISLV